MGILLNPILTHWLNGFDFSFRRLRYRPFSWLLAELSKTVGTPVTSVGEAYETLYGGWEVVAIKQTSAAKQREFDLAGRDAFLKPCRELQQFIRAHFTKRELLGFYVHGSLATLDYVEGYSDFDTLVIVRKEVLEDPRWAKDFKRRLGRSNTFLYLLDPLQHHQHFMLTEYDLDHYFEPIFPVVLFDYAVELTSFGNSLSFKCLDARQIVTQQLAVRKFYFGEMWPKRRAMRAYDVKNAIQNIALLPTLYLQCKTGEHYYKRLSFDRARRDFSTELWSVVERATRVRQTCPYESLYPYWLRKWIGLHLHYKWLHLLHRRLDRNTAAAMEGVMGPGYLADAFGLAVAMEGHCCDAQAGSPECGSVAT